MKHWGIFLDEKLLVYYPNDNKGHLAALEDADFLYEETGRIHEVKFFEKGEQPQ